MKIDHPPKCMLREGEGDDPEEPVPGHRQAGQDQGQGDGGDGGGGGRGGRGGGPRCQGGRPRPDGPVDGDD